MTSPPAHSKWAISMAIILDSMPTSIMGGTINVTLPTPDYDRGDVEPA